MKNFLLKNLWCFIVIILSVGFLALGVVSAIFLSIGSAGLGVVCLFYAVKSKRKYNQLKDFSQEEEYFDATEYDFDEDVYYIGPPTKKKEIKKQFLSKMSALSPTVILVVLGVAFMSIAIMSVVKMFF